MADRDSMRILHQFIEMCRNGDMPAEMDAAASQALALSIEDVLSTKLVLPTSMTPMIERALSQMPWNLAGIAHRLRDLGAPIPRRAENEYAAAQFLMLSLALAHGPEFGDVFADILQAKRPIPAGMFPPREEPAAGGAA